MIITDLKLKLQELKTKYDELSNITNLSKLNCEIDATEEKTTKDGFWNDKKEAEAIFASLNALKKKKEIFLSLKNEFESIELIYEMAEDEPELLDEVEKNISRFEELSNELEILVLLSGEYDNLDALVEMHPGAGGTEANDWCDMLYRMYLRFTSDMGFKVEVVNFEEGDEAGIKSVTFKVLGAYAYGYLKSETGVHRLVRISPFDSNKRRHTSFASILVTPIFKDDINIEIKDEDIKIDVFHSSGAGGQSVNTTDSAVRITHLPTKIVVTCQNERSQLQNKAQAMIILKNRLYLLELEKQKSLINDVQGEKQAISFGSQIRSYVFQPYQMVKDHRTGFEASQIDKVMNGDLLGFVKEYLKYIK